MCGPKPGFTDENNCAKNWGLGQCIWAGIGIVVMMLNFSGLGILAMVLVLIGGGLLACCSKEENVKNMSTANIVLNLVGGCCSIFDGIVRLQAYLLVQEAQETCEAACASGTGGITLSLGRRLQACADMTDARIMLDGMSCAAAKAAGRCTSSSYKLPYSMYCPVTCASGCASTTTGTGTTYGTGTSGMNIGGAFGAAMSGGSAASCNAGCAGANAVGTIVLVSMGICFFFGLLMLVGAFLSFRSMSSVGKPAGGGTAMDGVVVAEAHAVSMSAPRTSTPPRGGGGAASKPNMDPMTRSMALQAAKSQRANTPPRGGAAP